MAADYNSRLFKKGLYGSHHRARFHWLTRQIAHLDRTELRVLELGCFDGRAIDHVPCKITHYVGFDAGWESDSCPEAPKGLAAAIARFEGDPTFTFFESRNAADISRLNKRFDVAFALETFEHLPPEKVETYLQAIAGKLDGPLFITVPCEKGLPLLFKAIASKFLKIRRSQRYTRSEFMAAVLGQMHKVARDEHKGFDYAELRIALSKYFRSVQVLPVSCRWLPIGFQLTVGFACHQPIRLRTVESSAREAVAA